MKDNNIKIYRPKKFFKFIFLAISLFFLAGTVTLLVYRIRGNLLIALMLFIFLIYTWLFIYDLKRKIIITDSGIDNIRIPSPLLPMNRAIAKVPWTQIKVLKFSGDLLFRKFISYYVITKKGRFVHISPVYIENAGELIEYIEKKTKKKFKEMKLSEEL